MSNGDLHLTNNPLGSTLKLPARHFVIGMMSLFVISILIVCVLLIRLHFMSVFHSTTQNLHNITTIQQNHTQEIVKDIQSLMLFMASGLDYDKDTTEDTFTSTKDLTALQALWIVDNSGQLIKDTSSDDLSSRANIATSDYFTVHQSSNLRDFYVGKPAQGIWNDGWSIPLSYPVVKNNELQNVIVALISPQSWSASFDAFSGIDDYISIITDTNGLILTTHPYDPTNLGMQRDSLPLNTIPATWIQTLTATDLTLNNTVSLDSLSMNLTIAVADVDTIIGFDTVVITIMALAVMAMITSACMLWLYFRQYAALRLQSTDLYQTNQNLNQEIQQRKVIEQILSESEQRFRFVNQVMSDYAFVINVRKSGGLELEWVSDKSYFVTGYTDDDLETKIQPTSRCHPDDIAQLQQDMERTLAGEETVSEYRTQKKSGEYTWIRVKRHPIWDEEEGRVTQFVGAATDISSRKEVELALIQSEERYRIIAEIISGYAFAVSITPDGDKQIDWVTDSFYEMFGYTEEDLRANISPIVRSHPDDAEQLAQDMALLLQGSNTVSEYRAQIKSGEYIWIRVERHVICDPNTGKVLRFIGVANNITARKQAELALRESEERYRTVTEMISDYAFSTIVNDDNSWTREWLTESFYTMTGYERDEVMNRKPDPIVRTHPDDVEQVQQDIARTMMGEETVSEYRWRVASGDYIWTRVKRRPIWNHDHTRIERIIGAVTDITSQKQVELALRESESLYRMMTELMSDYVFSCTFNEDGSWETDWVTDAFYTITGYSASDMNANFNASDRIHPQDRPIVFEAWQKLLKGEKSTTEYRTRAKDGSYVWLRVTRQPIRDVETGNVVRFMGVGSDITAQKEAELALLQNEMSYREVTELMTDYAFSINVDIDGTQKLDWVVGSYEAIIGKTDVLTQGDDYFVDENERHQVERDQQSTLRGEQTVSEYRIRNQVTQNIHWLRVTRQPIWDAERQRVVRFVGAASDITAQKDAELALQLSQKHYQEVTELMSDYAFSVIIREDGLGGGLEWVVGAIEQTTGLHPRDVMRNPVLISRLTHPDDRKLLETDLERTLYGEKTTTQYRIIHAQSREIVWLQVSRQPIWSKDKSRVERAIVVASDVTSQKEAEFALASSEERYRLISEVISDYIYSEKIYQDQSSEIEWIAGSLESIVGASIEDVYKLGKIPLKIHPNDYSQVKSDQIAIRSGQMVISEYRVTHATDESIHWVRESRRPVFKDGELIRIIGAVSDITNEKIAEEALRDSEERYRILTDLMSDYVYSLAVNKDDMLEMEWFVGSFEEITGFPMEEFRVTMLDDMTRLTVSDDLKDVRSSIVSTLQGEATTDEYRIVNAVDHQPRWIRVSRYPVVDNESGDVIRILGATTDITAQKQAELALRDSEERYRLLTELLTDYAFLIRINEDGSQYREWMVGDYEGVMGYSIPSSGEVAYPQHIDQNSPQWEMIQEHLAQTLQGKNTVTEYEIVHQKTQETRWIRITRQPIWDQAHTRVVSYVGTVKDITVEKEADFIAYEADQLRQDLEREKGLHELRVRFVSMVTHEFRNPLAAIQSSVSILDKYNERLTPVKRQEKFERIYGQIDRLTNLLEDLLEIGELENYMLRYSPQRVDIVGLIADLYTEYQETIGHNHKLILNHEADKIMTYGDIKLLEQTFGNIISNAIKYSPKGGDIISSIAVQNQEIVVTIQDFGIGIPPRDYDNLFKAFYRASNVSTQPGTGLGLIIARQSVELHKGTIDFVSELGAGTTFTITLPQIVADTRHNKA